MLDYVMPKMNGAECLCAIRSDPELQDIPVIILTSDSDRTTQNELEELGCCSFLRKPINIKHFNSAIQDCLMLANKSKNQRKNIRVPLSLMALVQYQDEKHVLYATSFSHEGMFLRTVAPFDIGTDLDIIVNVDLKEPVKLKGRVIYIIRMASELDKEPGMGIQFISLPVNVRSRITSFVIEKLTNSLIMSSEIDHIYTADDPYPD
jgi:CheY-like chemotaxis protein